MCSQDWKLLRYLVQSDPPSPTCCKTNINKQNLTNVPRGSTTIPDKKMRGKCNILLKRNWIMGKKEKKVRKKNPNVLTKIHINLYKYVFLHLAFNRGWVVAISNYQVNRSLNDNLVLAFFCEIWQPKWHVPNKKAIIRSWPNCCVFPLCDDEFVLGHPRSDPAMANDTYL